MQLRSRTPDANLKTTGLYNLHPDHLGSPRAASDESGQVIWRWNSEPFGGTLPEEDPDGDGQPFILNLRFPGQYFDVESGLYYNYFRYYDPKIGRYITADPIGLNGGINDPLGLRPTKNPKGPDGQPIEHGCVTMCWANAVGSTMLAGAAGMGIGALVGRMGLGVAGATAGGGAIHVGSSGNSAYGFVSLAECLEQCEEEEETCK
nr:RHS repeat-associated core domain-containing protein [Thiolapillus sp.]